MAESSASATGVNPTSASGEMSLKRKAEEEGSTQTGTEPQQHATATADTPRSSRGGRGGSGDRGRASKRGRGRGGARMSRDGGGGGGDGMDEDERPGSSYAPATAQPTTPTQQQFAIYARYMDDRNERRELIYQSSRDLTRHSKKLISFLQRCTGQSDRARQQTMLQVRETQLPVLHRMIEEMIQGCDETDLIRFAGAYSAGFQEYIESASLLHYLETGSLVSHDQLMDDIERTLGKRILIPLSDYITGIMDLGGELMRFATNSIGTTDRDAAVRICTFFRQVYAQLQQLTAIVTPFGPYRELPKKMDVWMQSMMKVETLCYKLTLRRAEFPNASPELLATLLKRDLQQSSTSGKPDMDNIFGEEGGGAGGGGRSRQGIED